MQSSFESTLEHLHTDYLDSYVLHSPSAQAGLTAADWEVWEAMEQLALSGRAKVLGISNTGLHHLKALCAKAKVKPAFVQNRCYAAYGWDADVREYCLAHKIVYQGFSLLTANPHVVASAPVAALARRLEATPEQVVFRFAKEIGILPLTGTTDPRHMKDDLAALELAFTAADAAAISALS